MDIQIYPILNREKMEYGYELAIFQNGEFTTRKKLIKTADFMDITVKSAELQALITILTFILKTKQKDITIRINSKCVIDLIDGNIIPRRTLSKQVVKLHNKCRKQTSIEIKKVV